MSVREAKEAEFISLIQGNRTILQYKAKFMELMRFTPHISENEERKARKFQKGLCPSIRTKMASVRLRTFVEVVDIAMMVEQECDEVQ